MGADEFNASVPALKVLADAMMAFSPDRLFPPMVMGTLTIKPSDSTLELEACMMSSSASAGTPLYVCSDGL
jgi:hypothetical protein